MVQPLGREGDPGHEAERLAEVGEGEGFRDGVALGQSRPARKLGETLRALRGREAPAHAGTSKG